MTNSSNEPVVGPVFNIEQDPYHRSHENADTDLSVSAIHHTLGHGSFQAAPGPDAFRVGDVGYSTRSDEQKRASGWLPCDGGAYSPGQFPELFKIIDYDYGSDGDKFLVPNISSLDTNTGNDIVAYIKAV